MRASRSWSSLFAESPVKSIAKASQTGHATNIIAFDRDEKLTKFSDAEAVLKAADKIEKHLQQQDELLAARKK